MKSLVTLARKVAPAIAIGAMVLALTACPGGPFSTTAPAAPTNVKITVSTADKVTLTWSSVSNATAYRVYRAVGTGSYSKLQESIAEATHSDSTVAALTTYSYQVTAYNYAGESERSTEVTTTTPDVGSTVASGAIQEGIAALTGQPADYNLALTKFGAAVQADPTNATAILWNGALTLMSTMVNSDVRTLASDYIGIAGYPTDMNTLFHPVNGGPPAWITYTTVWYSYAGPGQGSYSYDPSDGTYTHVEAGHGDYETRAGGIFPQIIIPENIRGYDGDPTNTDMPEYLLGLLYNVITKNANGFNALTDQVVDNVLGKAFDQLLTSLAAVPDDAKIGFTWDMFMTGESTFPADSAWPTDAEGNPITFYIGKAELQALSSSLQFIKASALMMKTVSYNLPALTYWNALDPLDKAGPLYNGVGMAAAALYSLDTPFHDGFLGARSDALTTLGKAKAAMLGALGDLNQATTAILARTSSSPFVLSPGSPVSPIADNWSAATQMLNYEQILTGKMIASINTGSSVVIPTGVPEYFGGGGGVFDVAGYIGKYSVAANWPAAPDDGPYYTVENGWAVPTAIAFNLKPAFESTLGALTAFVEMDSNGEPKWYKFDLTYGSDGGPVLHDATSDYTATSSMDAATAQSQSRGTAIGSVAPEGQVTMYAFKVRDLTSGGSLVLDDTAYANAKAALKQLLTDMGAPITPEVIDKLIQRDEGGAISVYLPTVPAFMAYNSFDYGHPGDELALDLTGNSTTDLTYSTKGSFWWALYTDYANCGTLFGNYIQLPSQ